MAGWISDKITVNGVGIHYHRTGGDGPPVVMLHGITDNGLCWTRVAQALESDYDLILVDARGHGASDTPESGYGPGNHAADVAGLIHALELGRPVVMGHSMGASVAATVAAEYPDLVRAVVLEDPPWRATASTPEEQQMFSREFTATILEQHTQTREALMETRASMWHEAELGPWADAKLQVSPQVVQFITEPRPSWREVCHRIACRVLLITGDPGLEAIVTQDVADEVMQLCRAGQVVHISGAGHNIRRDQFERYMQAVTDFLRTL